MAEKDLTDRFVDEIVSPAAAPTTLLSLAELQALQAHGATLAGRGQGGALPQDLRDRLSGKPSELLPELLVHCARGLTGQGDFAAEIHVPAKVVGRAAKQDAALGHLVKATGDVHRATEEAADQIADRAEELGETILGAAEDRIAAGRDPGRTLATRFGEPFRLYEDARGKRDKLAARRDRALRPHRAAVDKVRGETDQLRLVSRYLDEIQGGKDDEV